MTTFYFTKAGRLVWMLSWVKPKT